MDDIVKNFKNQYFMCGGTAYRRGTRFKMNYPFDKTCPTHNANGESEGLAQHPETVEVVAYLESTDNDGNVNIRLEEYPWKKTKYGEPVSLKESEFLNSIIEIIPLNFYDEMEMKKKYLKDSQIPGLVIGWILYIVIMLILVIFNDRILGWIAASVYFFTWRHEKKEKEGVYFDQGSL